MLVASCDLYISPYFFSNTNLLASPSLGSSSLVDIFAVCLLHNLFFSLLLLASLAAPSNQRRSVRGVWPVP